MRAKDLYEEQRADKAEPANVFDVSVPVLTLKCPRPLPPATQLATQLKSSNNGNPFSTFNSWKVIFFIITLYTLFCVMK